MTFTQRDIDQAAETFASMTEAQQAALLAWVFEDLLEGEVTGFGQLDFEAMEAALKVRTFVPPIPLGPGTLTDFSTNSAGSGKHV